MQSLTILLTICVVVIVGACRDDDNPVKHNPAEKVNIDTLPADTTGADTTLLDTTPVDTGAQRDTVVVKPTMTIESVDASSICPRQQIIVHGTGFPLLSAELGLKIGGIPTKAYRISETQFTATVPWQIKHGTIQLFGKSNEAITSWQLEIPDDCEVDLKRASQILLDGPFNICPCDLITSADGKYPNYGILRYILGEYSIGLEDDYSIPARGFKVPVDFKSGRFRITSADGEELFISDSVYTRSKRCWGDMEFSLTDVEMFARAVDSAFYSAVAGVTADTTIVGTAEGLIPLSRTIKPEQRENCDVYWLFDKKRVVQNGDTLIRLTTRFVPSTEYSFESRLIIVFYPGTDTPKLAVYREISDSPYCGNHTRSKSRSELDISIDLSSVTGFNNAHFELRGSQLEDIVRIRYSRYSRQEETWSGNTIDKFVNTVQERVIATDSSKLTLRLERPQ